VYVGLFRKDKASQGMHFMILILFSLRLEFLFHQTACAIGLCFGMASVITVAVACMTILFVDGADIARPRQAPGDRRR